MSTAPRRRTRTRRSSINGGGGGILASLDNQLNVTFQDMCSPIGKGHCSDDDDDDEEVEQGSSSCLSQKQSSSNSSKDSSSSSEDSSSSSESEDEMKPLPKSIYGCDDSRDISALTMNQSLSFSSHVEAKRKGPSHNRRAKQCTDENANESTQNSSSCDSNPSENHDSKHSTGDESLVSDKKETDQSSASDDNSNNNEEEQEEEAESDVIGSDQFSSEMEFGDDDEEQEDDDGSEEYVPNDAAAHGEDSFFTDGSDDEELEVDEGMEEEEPEWVRRRQKSYSIVGNEDSPPENSREEENVASPTTTKTPPRDNTSLIMSPISPQLTPNPNSTSKSVFSSEKEHESPASAESEHDNGGNVMIWDDEPEEDNEQSTVSSNDFKGLFQKSWENAKTIPNNEEGTTTAKDSASMISASKPEDASEASKSFNLGELVEDLKNSESIDNITTTTLEKQQNEEKLMEDSGQDIENNKEESICDQFSALQLNEESPVRQQQQTSVVSPSSLPTKAEASTSEEPQQQSLEKKDQSILEDEKTLQSTNDNDTLDDDQFLPNLPHQSPTIGLHAYTPERASTTLLWDDSTVPSILSPSSRPPRNRRESWSSRRLSTDSVKAKFGNDEAATSCRAKLLQNPSAESPGQQSASSISSKEGATQMKNSATNPSASPTTTVSPDAQELSTKDTNLVVAPLDDTVVDPSITEHALEKSVDGNGSTRLTRDKEQVDSRANDAAVSLENESTSSEDEEAIDFDDDETEVEDEEDVDCSASFPSVVEPMSNEAESVVAVVVDDYHDDDTCTGMVSAVVVDDEDCESETEESIDSSLHNSQRDEAFKSPVSTQSTQIKDEIPVSMIHSPTGNDDHEEKQEVPSSSRVSPPIESVLVGSTSNEKEANKVEGNLQRKDHRERIYRRDSSSIIKRGKWTLGSQIGKGSFGVVRMGMNKETGMLFCVKIIQTKRFDMTDIKREIELLKELDHTNIVKYYGAEMDRDRALYIFQEWVPGGSVTSMLQKFGPFSMQVMRIYLSQVLEGLAYLHDNNILHRDVKGSNILVNDEGIVKLADFGASKKVAELQGAMLMTMTMRGTPYFMAPEVFEERYGYGSDIWSVGCVAIQMITGMPPWKELGINSPVLLYNHIKQSSGPPLDWNKVGLCSDREMFDALLNKCFLKTPQQRPSAAGLQQEPFFLEIRSQTNDEQTVSPRSLFSEVGNRTSYGWENLVSPATQRQAGYTPTKQTSCHRRSNSIGGLRSPFMSPPIPKHCEIRHRSPFGVSPQQDTTDWPTWARTKAKFSAKKQMMESPTEAATSRLLESLAISEDSSLAVSFKGRNLFSRTIGVVDHQSRSIDSSSQISQESKLKGEDLLDSA